MNADQFMLMNKEGRNTFNAISFLRDSIQTAGVKV